MSKENEQHKTRTNCFILDIWNLNTLNLLYFVDLIITHANNDNDKNNIFEEGNVVNCGL